MDQFRKFTEYIYITLLIEFKWEIIVLKGVKVN